MQIQSLPEILRRAIESGGTLIEVPHHDFFAPFGRGEYHEATDLEIQALVGQGTTVKITPLEELGRVLVETVEDAFALNGIGKALVVRNDDSDWPIDLGIQVERPLTRKSLSATGNDQHIVIEPLLHTHKGRILVFAPPQKSS